MSTEHEIGDIVEVVHTGHYYSSYNKWAAHHKLHNWTPDNRPKKGEHYRIIAKGEHLTFKNDFVYAIECPTTGKQSLIESAGIKAVSKLKYLGFYYLDKPLPVSPNAKPWPYKINDIVRVKESGSSTHPYMLASAKYYEFSEDYFEVHILRCLRRPKKNIVKYSPIEPECIACKKWGLLNAMCTEHNSEASTECFVEA
jgi:hypothetical protein